jgi:hypothetical protein
MHGVHERSDQPLDMASKVKAERRSVLEADIVFLTPAPRKHPPPASPPQRGAAQPHYDADEALRPAHHSDLRQPSTHHRKRVIFPSGVVVALC